MSAASFLGIAGLIALYGYDGFLYSIGFLVAWLVALLLVAELMRNTGKFTMADVLSFRMRQRPVRTAASISTVVVSIFYLLAQMVGAGELVALLLGISSQAAKNLVIVGVGMLMIVYVVFGGMKGTTWVQIVKAVMLMTGAAIMTIWVLAKFGFNPSALLGAAADASGKGESFLQPGLRYGVENADSAKALISKLDFISLALALVLGTAGLPHILIRFYTVPDSKAARKSVLWAIGLIGIFYLMTLALGFGAAALVGVEGDIRAESRRQHGGSATRRGTRRGRHRARCRHARGDRRGRLRHHPCGGGRPDAGGVVVAGARPVRERDQEGEGHRQAGGQGRPDRGGVHRRGVDRAGHPGAIAERGVPGGDCVCHRGVGEPAGDPVLAVLEAVQHPGRDLGDLRRAVLCAGAAGLLAERLRWRGQRHHRQGGQPDQRSGDQLRLVPVEQPGPGVDPARASCSPSSGPITSKEYNKAKWAEMEVRSLTGAHAEKATQH